MKFGFIVDFGFTLNNCGKHDVRRDVMTQVIAYRISDYENSVSWNTLLKCIGQITLHKRPSFCVTQQMLVANLMFIH